MRLKKLHIAGSILAAGIAITTLSSNSSGSPDVMGHSATGCGGVGCHAASASTSTVLAVTGLPANGWNPNTTYTLTATVTNSTALKAGFDLKVSTGTISNASAGTMAMGTEIHHTAAKAMTSGTASWTFSWTAPASRTNPLIVNMAGNAVNGDGSATSADIWNTTGANGITFNAASGTSIASINEGGFSVYPNPVKDQLTITAKAGQAVQIAAIAIDGRHVAVATEKVTADKYLVNTSTLATGVYMLVLSADGKTYATRFVKQ